MNKSEDTLTRIEQHLRRIANALDADRPAPKYSATLAAYPGFDWSTIAATELARDDNGATRVKWNRHVFTRRSNATYGPGIWFSRGAGRDDDGNLKYARLITFSPRGAVEPLVGKVLQALATSPAPTAPAPTAPAPAAPQQDPSELDRYFPRPGEAPQDTPETERQRFMRLLPVAIAAGLEPGDANSLTAIATRNGYTEPLATLEAHITRLEAHTP